MADTRTIGAVAAVVLTVAACGTSVGATKAGGSTPTVTLTLGTDDDREAPSGPVIESFAERVRDLSDGALVVEPAWAASRPDGQGVRDWDQRIARMVVGGELDMALVPSRAWDTEGVGTLRPLSAPMSMTSQALVAEVVRGELAGEMLAGLEAVDVTGLALVPEDLRHVFSFGEPLAAPAAFAGARLRVPHSETTWAVFRSWGATPDDLTGAEMEAALADGQVDGAESSFARAGGLGGPPPTVAGNLTTSANVYSLVIGTDVLDGLTEAQGDVLRRAAADLREEVLADWPDEASQAADFCADGGRVVTAEDADLDALSAAAEPVRAQLGQDPATAGVLARIEELRATLPVADPIAPCDPGAPPAPGAAGVLDTAGEFPEGTYRAEVTAADLLAGGASQQDAGNHGGIWTLTFDHGRLVVDDVRARDGQHSTDEGVYCVSDGRVSVAPGQDEACEEPVLFSAAWELDGRELLFTEVRPGGGARSNPLSDALWGTHVWTRID